MAFLINKTKPFLIFLFSWSINDKECLTECKKQKYIVNAKIGLNKKFKINIEKKSINKRDFISIFSLNNKNKVEKKLSINKIYKKISSTKIIPDTLKFKDWKINIVSILWKSKGETTTKIPFKKYNIPS